ncbi:MAG: DNA methyltransferase [Dehalococcoidia bacterium]
MESLSVAGGRRLGITGNPNYDGAPLTNFASVTPATPLEALNLNWRERDLPEHERTKHVHRLHPYLGKFVPQLVEIFLRKYQPRVVCDPFCGSGTALVEANALGIDSVGCDISPFNCLLSKVKTDHYDVQLLELEINDILTQIHLQLKPGLFSGSAEVEDTPNEYLRAWFAPQARHELLSYRALIPNYRYQDVLRIILSRAARSARLTTHFDLDFPKEPVTEPYFCHKHRRTCRPTRNALRFLHRYSLDTLRRLKEFAAVRTDARIQVIRGDARQVRFPECDMVLTSPPYVGLIDYHEQHRYAYELLGLDGYRDLEIGASWKGNSEKAVRVYMDEMADAFSNVRKSLAKGSVMVIVVHDRRDIYDRLAHRLGFTVEYRLQRHVNRRTGRRASDFFEDVMVWRT